jgi:hypothetical protein
MTTGDRFLEGAAPAAPLFSEPASDRRIASRVHGTASVPAEPLKPERSRRSARPMTTGDRFLEGAAPAAPPPAPDRAWRRHPVSAALGLELMERIQRVRPP